MKFFKSLLKIFINKFVLYFWSCNIICTDPTKESTGSSYYKYFLICEIFSRYKARIRIHAEGDAVLFPTLLGNKVHV